MYLSAISIVEVRYLVEKFRLTAEVLEGLLGAIEAGVRLVHLSLVELDNDYWCEHIAFRDALRADAELAHRYAVVKRELARRYPHDRIAYTEAKTDFIRGVLLRVPDVSSASGWAAEGGG